MLFLDRESVIRRDGDICQEIRSFDMVVTIIPGLQTMFFLTIW